MDYRMAGGHVKGHGGSKVLPTFPLLQPGISSSSSKGCIRATHDRTNLSEVAFARETMEMLMSSLSSGLVLEDLIA